MPLRSASPSFASSESGARPAAARPSRGGAPLAANERLADAEQRRGEVRERGEVARGADRALLRDHRQDVGVEERKQRLDHREANARVAAPEAGDLGREHEANDGCRHRPADPHGVGEHEVSLQQVDLVARDVLGGEAAEAGVDAVGGLAALDDGAHGRRARLDGGDRRRVQAHAHAARGERAKLRGLEPARDEE